MSLVDEVINLGAPNSEPIAELPATGMRSVIAFEGDEYSGALPGITLDVVRTGRGFGPNEVTSHVDGKVMIARTVTRIPSMSTTTVHDDTIVVVLVGSAPPLTRWSGIDVVPNSMILFSPGAIHAAISPAGVSFTTVSVSDELLKASAEHREGDFQAPESGRIMELDPTPEVTSLARAMRTSGDRLAQTRLIPRSEDIVRAVGSVLACEPVGPRSVSRRRSDSRELVGVCIEWADAQTEISSRYGLGQRPSISELRAVAHVSERRLRNAFYDAFGVGPQRYFRMRSMSIARRLLLDARGRDESVSEIAQELGYYHVSRFASYYQDVFGEYPSETAAS